MYRVIAIVALLFSNLIAIQAWHSRGQRVEFLEKDNKSLTATVLEHEGVVEQWKKSLSECRDLVSIKSNDISALQSYIINQQSIIEGNELDKKRDGEIINEDQECNDWARNRVCTAIDRRLRDEDQEDRQAYK